MPLHFTGVHVLSPALLDHVPDDPFACDVNRRVYPPLLAAGQVRAVVAGGYWNDLGTPERYLQANLDLLSGEAPVALPGADPFAGAEARGARVFVAEGASVDPSARLLGPVLVAAGSRRRGGGRRRAGRGAGGGEPGGSGRLRGARGRLAGNGDRARREALPGRRRRRLRVPAAG